MAAFEGSMKNMLQGVSQQLQRERLEGQVTAQNNMLSDVVTGLRRRPGAEVQTAWVMGNATRDQILGWDSDLGGQRIKLILNGADGNLRVCDDNWGLLQTIQNDYLKFTDRTSIQHTVCADLMFIVNKDKIPFVATTGAGPDPTKMGYYFIKAGAFSHNYTVTVSYGTNTWTGLYSTPDGTHTGDAALSTPQAIAAGLQNSLVANGFANVAVSGAYAYCVSPSPTLSVTTTDSSNYIGVSNASRIPSITDLPSRLPTGTDGYVVAVGSSNMPTYYRWDATSLTWKEDAAHGSPASLGNMPLYLSVNNTTSVWSLGSTYEGRLAGDNTSNPLPSFINYGIDGMGAFQGRLVLLNGSKVTMSASAHPTRFFRSTVDELLSADVIEVGASANSSAAYQYCVPFNKDLILFSEKYQALVPGGGAVVTPQNATVVVTSQYEADMAAPPLALGRTVMFPKPRSADFFGVMEMLPSAYTDSQYTSQDVTAHLPKYMPGRNRFSVSSSVANIAAFATTSDYRQLVVHEYTWDGDSKVQQAWHKWYMPYDIADAFFSGSDINLLLVSNGQLLIAALDPRVGTLTVSGDRRPFLDIYFPGTVVDHQLAIPAFYQSFDPNFYLNVRLADVEGDLFGEEVGIDERYTDHVVTVPSFGDGSVSLGISYVSSVMPSMPTVKDSNGVVISSNKLTLLRFMIGTENSYEYEATVVDSSDDGADTDDQLATLYWGSTDLDLGDPRIAVESTAILPCRTNAASTDVTLFSDSLGELNIVSLEYVCRYNQKLKRR